MPYTRGRELTHVTTDHEVIRRWAGERDGVPAVVERTLGDDGDGILRIDFPGYDGEDSLVPVEWDDWFDTFEEAGLAFVYQEETSEGERSRFNMLIDRTSVAGRL